MTFIMGIIFLLLFMALRKKGEEHMSHEDYQHLICIFLLPSSYSMLADLLACYHLNSDYLIETDKHNYSKGIIFDDFHCLTASACHGADQQQDQPCKKEPRDDSHYDFCRFLHDAAPSFL